MNKTILLSALALLLVISLPANFLRAFAYIFAGESNGVDVVTHPIGYNGTGGPLGVTIGIDPTSAHADSMSEPVQNVIAIFNGLIPTTGNLLFGGTNNIPAGHVDFESVLLHEMGHSLGLAHVNAATESGLTGDDQNYTKATDGVNNSWDLNAGPDAIRGSEDDVRGDDVNLHYFKMADNDPFSNPATIDATTYSRDVANLPLGDVFPTNADRTIGAAVGFADTESVMQQGTFSDEEQRTLVSDDVAGIRYAEAGLDEIAGNADDYDLNLVFAGLTVSADIVVDFDDSETGFAVSKSNGVFLTADHVAISSNNIYFNTGYSWFFNTSAVLPASWVHFSVEVKEQDALLHWATATTSNVDFFAIERSSDRENWQRVGKVFATAASGALRNYQFTDIGVGLHQNHLFYRVKEVDGEGSYSYSLIREIQFTRTEAEIITFGPIPVRAYSYAALHLMRAEPIQVRMWDLGGKVVDQWNISGQKGYQEIVLGKRLLHLPAGNYLLDISTPSVRQQIRLVR